MECEVQSVECSVECGVWRVKCKEKSVECGV